MTYVTGKPVPRLQAEGLRQDECPFPATGGLTYVTDKLVPRLQAEGLRQTNARSPSPARLTAYYLFHASRACAYQENLSTGPSVLQTFCQRHPCSKKPSYSMESRTEVADKQSVTPILMGTAV